MPNNSHFNIYTLLPTKAETSVYDAKAGISLDSNFAKVVSWYDNEWGYSNKIVEMARYIANK